MTTFSVLDRRVKPTTRRPFGEGILPPENPAPSTPIDQRTLPTINGAGLIRDEQFRGNGAMNRARVIHAQDCAETDPAELDRVARAAGTDALRAVLRDRPAAPDLTTPAIPVNPVKPAPARTRTFEPSATDRAWWAQHDNEATLGYLAPISGGAPELEPEPFCGISGAWFMPGEDLWPDEPELGDDASGALLGHEA